MRLFAFRNSKFELILEMREREKENGTTKSSDLRKLNKNCNFKFLICLMDFQLQQLQPIIPCFAIVLTKSSNNSHQSNFVQLEILYPPGQRLTRKIANTKFHSKQRRNLNSEKSSSIRINIKKQRLFTVKYFHNQKYLSLPLKY